MSLDDMNPYVGRPVVDQDGNVCGVARTDLRSLLVVEAYRDESGTIWTPPTAWAWAQLCKAHRLSEGEVDKLVLRPSRQNPPGKD